MLQKTLVLQHLKLDFQNRWPFLILISIYITYKTELILTSHGTLWRRNIHICESVRPNGHEHLSSEKHKENHTTIFRMSIASAQLLLGKHILNHEDKELHYAAAYDALLCTGRLHGKQAVTVRALCPDTHPGELN